MLTIEILRKETVARQIAVMIKMGESTLDFFVSTKTMAAKAIRAIRAFNAICHNGAEKNCASMKSRFSVSGPYEPVKAKLFTSAYTARNAAIRVRSFFIFFPNRA